MSRLTLFLIRLPGFHRLLHRVPERACWLCSRVWREVLRDPTFQTSLDEGAADIEAGRWYRWNPDGTTTPNPDWPKDGPQPDHA